MSLKICECCGKPETACDCLGPRSLSCDFCGKDFQTNETYYESKAFRLLDGVPEDCGCDSTVLSCERCEMIRMRTPRWFRFFARWL